MAGRIAVVAVKPFGVKGEAGLCDHKEKPNPDVQDRLPGNKSPLLRAFFVGINRHVCEHEYHNDSKTII